MDVVVKRVYDEPAADDGIRVLIDRLWPRGVSKQRAHLDAWLREVAPSAELRTQWHDDPKGHDPGHFDAFADDYRAELEGNPALDELIALAPNDRLTLLTATNDPVQNHAVILRDVVLERVAAG